jgi:YbgC/YbaW family acyl-CoA thioester hydrolase
VTSVPAVDIRVYPDDCDARGHVNQASFLQMFERARWEALARGPGVGVFTRHGAWPVVRKATVEYYAEALPGDVLQFGTSLTHLGRTSFTLHQTARRASDQRLVAEGDLVFVCVDTKGKPTPVPDEIRRFFGTRPSVRAGAFQHLLVRGIATAVDVQGDGPGVVFVHGFPLDRTMWRHIVAPLTGWRRVAPDLRGMGLTDAPEGGYSLETYADDIVALLDVLEIDKAVVCGLSMGGYVALDLMRRHSGRVRALILSNTRAGADTRDAKAARDEMIQLVQREGPGAVIEQLLPKLLAPSSQSAMPQLVEHLRTMAMGSPTNGLVGALRAMRDRPDATDLLPTIDVPTLVVAGKEDRLIPAEEGKRLADAIPGAQFTVIPDAGHLAPMEQPTATSRVIAEFLQALL